MYKLRTLNGQFLTEKQGNNIMYLCKDTVTGKIGSVNTTWVKSNITNIENAKIVDGKVVYTIEQIKIINRFYALLEDKADVIVHPEGVIEVYPKGLGGYYFDICEGLYKEDIVELYHKLYNSVNDYNLEEALCKIFKGKVVYSRSKRLHRTEKSPYDSVEGEYEYEYEYGYEHEYGTLPSMKSIGGYNSEDIGDGIPYSVFIRKICSCDNIEECEDMDKYKDIYDEILEEMNIIDYFSEQWLSDIRKLGVFLKTVGMI